jgi:hypothetical protein
MLNLLFFKYLSKAFCRQMPQAHLLTGAVDTDIYPTPPLGMRAVNQRLLFPLKKEEAVAQGKNPSAAASLRLNASRSTKTLAIDPLISKKQITQTGPSE